MTDENKKPEEEEQEDPATMRERRLQNLRAKMNQAKVVNKVAAQDEIRRKTEGEAAVEAKRRKDAWLERKKQHERDVTDGIAEAGNSDLGITAAVAQERYKKKRKKEEGQASHGWEMFNIDTQVKTYKKRINRVHDSFGDGLQKKNEEDKALFEADPSKADDLEYSIVDDPTDAMRSRLKTELAVTESRRGTFSRRRAFDEDADVDYINDRNKKFNDKLKRHFDPFTTEIRQNLERGTAL
eukprot:TRINITY_DN13094_c0_g1_i1.p1 TRINITY_DN13094_c0_g1~~TRINITY_DN13094_c0_g1_i1.p1  ORF type:complete len:259 (+),score=90.76 TRINITY_DN13094_c0_g1_i1:59-778(+)